MIFPDARV